MRRYSVRPVARYLVPPGRAGKVCPAPRTLPLTGGGGADPGVRVTIHRVAPDTFLR